jgi:xanthine dehydrogenase YagS FAD-binding subunit
MNKITNINATTIEEAVSALGPNAEVFAGGTDLFGSLKGMVFPDPPETVVNIKTIPDMDYIREEGGMLKIGALATLTDIKESSIVQSKYQGLAEAVRLASTPALRNMGTIGGNLCQKVRCWYYRCEHNGFFCFRKGGSLCYLQGGNSERHSSIFGGPCFAAFPSDTAIPLIALDATVVTTKNNIPMSEFFVVLGNVLDDDEIVTEIQVPEPDAATKQVFLKFRQRKAIDWALSSVATAITVTGGAVSAARIVLGGVSPTPRRATGAEDAIMGQAITESVAAAAGDAAVQGAIPLLHNNYKVQITKTLVKRALLS